MTTATQDVSPALGSAVRTDNHRAEGKGHLLRLSCAAVICALAAMGVGAGLARANAPLAWTVTNVEQVDEGSVAGLSGVSCPSTSLCVAVDGGGVVVTSTNPTGGATAWSVASLEGGIGLDSVSCASVSLCVAGDSNGDVVTSTDPTGGDTAWTVTNIDPNSIALNEDDVDGVSCPSTSLCVAVDDDGSLFTSTNPTGGAAAWTATQADPDGVLDGLSCPSTSFCAAFDSSGNIVTSTDPTGGGAAWTVTHADPHGGLDDLSCPSTSFCGGVDNAGNFLFSTDPTGGAAAWRFPIHDNAALNRLSCPTTSFCATVDNNGNFVTSTDPTGDAMAWSVDGVDPGAEAWNHNYGGLYVSGLSCPSASLCVAVDKGGNVVLGTPGIPQGGGGNGRGRGTIDEISKLKLAARTVRPGKPVTFEVTLKAAATITTKILRFVPASGHGKQRKNAHYAPVGTLEFNGRTGLNKLRVSELHGKRLPAGRYKGELSAGGKPHAIAFTVKS